jgi:hypothetical protein
MLVCIDDSVPKDDLEALKKLFKISVEGAILTYRAGSIATECTCSLAFQQDASVNSFGIRVLFQQLYQV